MANTKEILTRINGIKDTMKITNAMYLISSSKLKKAKKNLDATLPFFETLQKTIAKIVNFMPDDITHEYFDKRSEISADEKKIGYVVVTADKGLAGAYNHNIIKMTDQEIEGKKNVSLYVVGEVGRKYYERRHKNYDPSFLYTSQDPSMHRARLITRRLINLYRTKQIDEFYLIYTKMISSMKEEPEMIQLFPLKKHIFEKHADSFNEVVQFHPSPEKVLTSIIPDYIRGVVYGALVESYFSEQNARMRAMEASTDNARDMLKELTLQYNSVRQAAITQEITEIVGGAKALKNKK